MKINLYNHFHNGDVFYSRALVTHLIDLGYDVTYFTDHPNSLLDLPISIRTLCDLPQEITQNDCVSSMTDSEVFINTWIGCEGFRHFYNSVRPGSTLPTHLSLWNTITDRLGIPPVTKLMTNYDLSLDITINRSGPYTLICNGPVKSDQSVNFLFEPIINQLQNKSPIILTDDSHRNQITNPNVLFVQDILGSNRVDLVSVLSNYCSTIIGRTSGPFICSQTRRNLSDPNKLFITFVNNLNDAYFIQHEAFVAANCKAFFPDPNLVLQVLSQVIK